MKRTLSLEDRYIKLVQNGSLKTAQRMVNCGEIAMNEYIYTNLPVVPKSTQIGTTIHLSLEKMGKVSKDSFQNGRGLVYGSGLGEAVNYLEADSFEPFPPEGISPTYTNKNELNFNDRYESILCTYVLNVVWKEEREFIVKTIGKMLKKGGMAIIVTRGKDVLNSKPLQKFSELEVLTKKANTFTYQKGYTPDELCHFVQSTLGYDFEVKLISKNTSSVKVELVKL